MTEVKIPEKLLSEFKKAEDFAKAHYENFPVISLFLPKQIRSHVAVVYKFARLADDIADEGNLPPSERLDSLKDFRAELQKSLEGSPQSEFWKALIYTVNSFSLSHKNFFDLLSAFEQDISKKRYSNFEDLLDYCSRSANPVGRIILEFFNIRSEEAVKYSDNICTALQLTNFYQDIKIDLEKDRIYLPEDEMQKFGVDEKSFVKDENNSNFKSLLRYQIERADMLFQEGKKLIPFLPRSLKYQIKWTILGGEEILKKIRSIDYEVLTTRPKLTKIDYLRLMIKSFWNTG